MPDGGPEPHPDLAPLLFLLGRWEGAGVGGYPTIESFRFGQEITFGPHGEPSPSAPPAVTGGRLPAPGERRGMNRDAPGAGGGWIARKERPGNKDPRAPPVWPYATHPRQILLRVMRGRPHGDRLDKAGQPG